MQQLFYLSSARDGLKSDDLNKIVDSALRFNNENDITGIILYRGGIFLQLLEGEATLIQNLFEKIKLDHRHTNIVEVFNIPCKKRIFTTWSEGYREITEFDLKTINEVLSWNKLISAAREIDSHLILHMLERFKAKF